MKEKGIAAPWMPEVFYDIEDDCEFLKACAENETLVHEMILRDAVAGDMDFSRLCSSKVRFENCTFLNCNFDKAEFTDVVFKACNISNCSFSDSYFNRCQMISSKGMGAKFTGSSIQNMVFQDCNLEYANFDSSKLEKIRFQDVELNHGNISQCRCKDVEWEKARLQGTSFFKTSLRKMDFTTCTISELVLSDECSELKGAVVDFYQAAELAKRLGLIIK